MRIRGPDETGILLASGLLAPAQAAGLPMPACLLGIEALRLLAAVGIGLGALAAVGTQGVMVCLGAALMTRSALALIPIYRGEWRSWDGESRAYYRERALRMRESGSVGRILRGVLALAFGLGVAVTGLPGTAWPVGAGIAALLWIDLLSLYAACVVPRP